MIYLCLTFWITGAMFTIGFIDGEKRPFNAQAQSLAIAIWPALLGSVLSERLKIYGIVKGKET